MNDQLVGMHGGSIVVQYPEVRMSKAAALRHAAWLVALADETGEEFAAVLEAVRNT